MRRAALSALVLAIALVLQLTVVNRLPLPGGSAPDLVLLAVVALALCGGPELGMIAGFCGGLSLDLAPPASQLIGQYALVFCVVGYGCGKLRGTLHRSAVLPIIIAASAAVAGELLAAGFGLALDPAQVSSATVRQVLPFSVLCDVLLSGLVLYLVMLAYQHADDRAGAGQPERRPAAGGGLLGGAGWLAGRYGSTAVPSAAARRSPAGAGAATRLKSGWAGGRQPAGRRPAARPGPTGSQGQAVRAGRRATPRLRPRTGITGSAARADSARRNAAGSHPPVRIQPGRPRRAGSHPGRSQPPRIQPGQYPAAGRLAPGRPVNLKLAGRRRGPGFLAGPGSRGAPASARPRRPVAVRFRSRGPASFGFRKPVTPGLRRPVRIGFGKPVRFWPRKPVRLGSGKRARLGSAKPVRIGFRKPVRLGFLTRGPAGRRSGRWRIGSRRTGGLG
jgi:rod shape-determining protein MreD